MIGKKLSPILEEIEDALWEFEYYCPDKKPKYTKVGFRSSIKIFMSALMERMWDKQELDNMPINKRIKMVVAVGKEIRQLVKRVTGIDSHDLYK